MKKSNRLSFEEFLETLIGKNITNQDADLADAEKTKLEKILENAYDIRKFELDLYWKRATYFWGFLVAAYTALFVLIDKKLVEYQFLVVCLGLIFSLAWYLVNRGSTYWVTNYERVIDAIEEKLGTEFYKLNLENEFSIFNLQQNYSFSVSRINIKVSLFILLTWVLLFARSIKQNWEAPHRSWLFICTVIITIWMLFYMLYSKSSLSNTYHFIKRKSVYDKKIARSKPV